MVRLIPINQKRESMKSYTVVVTQNIPASATRGMYAPSSQNQWTFSDCDASDVRVAIRSITRHGNSGGKNVIPERLDLGKTHSFTFEVTRTK